jgi:hypothetical protein
LSSDPYRPSVYTPFLRRFTDEKALDLADTIALFEEVSAAHRASLWSKPQAIEGVNTLIAEWIGEVIELPQSPTLLRALDQCQQAVLANEVTIFSAPESRWNIASLSLKEQVDLRRFLRAQQHFLANDDKVSDLLSTALGNVFGGIVSELTSLPAETTGSAFTVPLVSLLRNPGDVVDRIIGTICKDELAQAGLFAELQRQFYENICHASGVLPDKELRKPLITADESELPPSELIEAYLKGTPFLEFFQTPVPFSLSDETRFEHHWIVAGTGHGKTQALQYMIANDLERVFAGEASVVVIDSQGDLIRNISQLKLFADHPDKLCVIDPNDIEFPVALNLFDLGVERAKAYSLLEREKLQNAAVALYEFILTALLGAEMTSKQTTLFRYVLRAMLHVEGATIHTFREMMDGSTAYQSAIDQLSVSARTFFATEFNSREHEATKRQVVRRLWGILENQSFERMFSHPKSKFDMFAEMNAGKVILINTAKDLLKQEGSTIFGRFFIALLSQAAQERSAVPSARLPCFVYVDECADFLDHNVGLILAQARKFKVGMTLAHQYIGQLTQGLQEGFDANTSIKFVGGVSAQDARSFARMLRCEPSFIEDQPKGFFAAHVRNQTGKAVSLRVPFGHLEALPRMNGGEWARVQQIMRERYAASPVTPRPAAPRAAEPRQDTDDWRS